MRKELLFLFVVLFLVYFNLDVGFFGFLGEHIVEFLFEVFLVLFVVGFLFVFVGIYGKLDVAVFVFVMLSVVYTFNRKRNAEFLEHYRDKRKYSGCGYGSSDNVIKLFHRCVPLKFD